MCKLPLRLSRETIHLSPDSQKPFGQTRYNQREFYSGYFSLPQLSQHFLSFSPFFKSENKTPSHLQDPSSFSCTHWSLFINVWLSEAMSESITGQWEMIDFGGSRQAQLLSSAEVCAWRSLSLTQSCSCWRRRFTRMKFRPKGNSSIMPTIRSDMWPRSESLAARERSELILLSCSGLRKLPL